MAFSTIQGSGAAPDSFVGTSGVDTILIQNVRKAVFLDGDAANDVIQFTSFTELVSGYTLKGGQGNDTFTAVGPGFGTNISGSFINGNAGNDLIDLSLVSSSTILGGQGNDTFLADARNSILNGNAGNDIMNVFSAASSSVFGGQGVDTIRVTGAITETVIDGNLGNDNIFIGDATPDVVPAELPALTTVVNTTINGNDGNDLITLRNLTSFTNSTVFGGEGGDLIDASQVTTAGVAVFLSGDNGNDELIGGFGNDTISGGSGADLMTGTGGADTYLYTSVAETGTVATGVIDVITDFTSLTDTLAIRDTIKGFGLAGVQGVNYREGAGGTTYADALAAANAAFRVPGGNIQYFLASYGTDPVPLLGGGLTRGVFNAVLFIDLGSTGNAQGAINIGNTGEFATSQAALDSFAAGNILA